MDDLGLVGDLAIVVVAALLGGVFARLLRLPVVIGYLAAGIAIGPHTPGPTGNVEDVRTIAELGVALLMFTLGVRFSLGELSRHRGLALGSGIIATLLVLAVAFGVALGLGVDEQPAVVIGMVVSISSTMLAMRMLDDHGLIGTSAGPVAIVTTLVQDMIVVVMLVLIPLLAGKEDNLAIELGIAMAEAAALIAGIWVIGMFVLPPVLARLAESRSRELFLLAVLGVALGTASLSSLAGLSVAFGAFVGGLLISSSPYAQRTLNEVLPLREVFAVVFFVAIGMLIDPDSFADRPDLVFGFAAVAIFAKVVLVGAPGLLLGYSARSVVPAAIALANMGEFSFVLITQAVDEDILSPTLRDIILASVLVTMALSPIIFLAQERLTAFAERFTAPAREDVPVAP
jgi:CPA2 family monovalent cation:H+ antiporter-2